MRHLLLLISGILLGVAATRVWHARGSLEEAHGPLTAPLAPDQLPAEALHAHALGSAPAAPMPGPSAAREIEAVREPPPDLFSLAPAYPDATPPPGVLEHELRARILSLDGQQDDERLLELLEAIATQADPTTQESLLHLLHLQLAHYGLRADQPVVRAEQPVAVSAPTAQELAARIDALAPPSEMQDPMWGETLAHLLEGILQVSGEAQHDLLRRLEERTRPWARSSSP